MHPLESENQSEKYCLPSRWSRGLTEHDLLRMNNFGKKEK